jgi:VWFA-related protein
MRLVFAVVCAVTFVHAQQDPTFRTGVSLVHVDAEVLTQDGRIAGDLTQLDFRVLDNGKEEPIVSFGAGDESLDLILLFDISGSMRTAVEMVAGAARESLRQLRDGDRVAVMVFNTRSRVIAPFTTDLDDVEKSIRAGVLSLHFGGGTFIQSAAGQAAELFMKEKRTERRRAVLVITDNYGQRTRREASVVRDYWEADALLSALIVRARGIRTMRTIATVMSPQMLAFQVGVSGIAEKTGGDVIQAADPGAAFQQSMQRIRTRYSFYYALPESKPGAARSIRVELTREASGRLPKSRIRARTGYIVPQRGQ